MASWLNRVQVQWSRNSGVTEDVAVVDFSFAFVTGTTQAAMVATSTVHGSTPGIGVPASSDYTALMTAVESFLTSYAAKQCSSHVASYIACRVINAGQPSPNPAVATKVISHGGAASGMYPPQAAASVTLHTYRRPNWGRIYLPGIQEVSANATGRITGTDQTAIVGYLRTLASASATANWYWVVNNTKLADNASVVQSISMDNVFDVIRRRRWDRSTNTVTQALP